MLRTWRWGGSVEVEDAVGKAIRERLAAQLSCPVYDQPPRGAAMPFVSFDRHLVEPNDDLAEPMSRHRVYLTVWSDKRGPKEVRTILGGIRRALHWYDLELDEGEAVLSEVERTDATRDADGVTYMGTAQVLVLTDNR